MTLYQIPGIMKLIQEELPADVKSKKLEQKIENLFVTTYKQEYITEKQRSSEETVDRIWLYASLIDAALNEKSYPAQKYDCASAWDSAVRFLKFELNKRKFLSATMIHDVSKLCSMAASSMDCLNAASCGQSLVGWVKKYGESLTDLYEILNELKRRLNDTAETYQKYQYSLEPN